MARASLDVSRQVPIFIVETEPVPGGPLSVRWNVREVELDGVWIGDLEVVLALDVFDVLVRNLSIDAEDKGGYPHPHVAGDGRICWGGNDDAARRFHKAGDFLAVKDVVDNLLRAPTTATLPSSRWPTGKPNSRSASRRRQRPGSLTTCRVKNTGPDRTNVDTVSCLGPCPTILFNERSLVIMPKSAEARGSIPKTPPITKTFSDAPQNPISSSRADPRIENTGERHLRNASIIDQGRLNAHPVAVIGVGAIGSALSEMLVKLGVHDITLINFDEVDEVNLGVQGFYEVDVGKPKVEVVRERLLSINSGTHVTTYNEQYRPGLIESGAAVFSCVDSIRTRRQIFRDYRQHDWSVFQGND